MFREPNCMLFYLCNIFYLIVERFSLIRGCTHVWPNHVKTSCIFVEVILYFFVLYLLSSTSKLPLAKKFSIEGKYSLMVNMEGNQLA